MPSPEDTPPPRDPTPAQDVPGPARLRRSDSAQDPSRGERNSNLARGIVWADIVAEIAAEAKSRDMPEAA